MSLPTQPYKGSRDFYPEDKRLQKKIFKHWRKVVERYGYEEYDAPIIEPLELFLAKSSAEIVNEQTYAFEDRGNRKVVIRPEMTPSVSRMVAGRRLELAYPLRWYSIPNLWRYERPQRGRMREHWQLNVDLFGVSSLAGEHEVIQIADAILKDFGAKSSMYVIKINSRKLINELLSEVIGLDPTQVISMIRLIDHKDKMVEEHFIGQVDAIIGPAQREVGTADKLLDMLNAKDIDRLPPKLAEKDSVKELKQLMDLLKASKITNIEFDMTIMRGFDYYTDIVFEVYDTHPDNNRSMFGGGRYDSLVAMFGVEPIPTIGFGMGDVTLQNFLELHELLPELKIETDLYVVLIGEVYEQSAPLVAQMRDMGLKVAVDISGSKLDKQIKTADKKGFRYVLFIGAKEIDSNQFVLKNIVTGEEEPHSLERIVSIVKDNRQS